MSFEKTFKILEEDEDMCEYYERALKVAGNPFNDSLGQFIVIGPEDL